MNYAWYEYARYWAGPKLACEVEGGIALEVYPYLPPGRGRNGPFGETFDGRHKWRVRGRDGLTVTTGVALSASAAQTAAESAPRNVSYLARILFPCP